jgi:hypothetical protein
VLLEKHRILCPCCGCGTPAYERFLYPYVYGWLRHPGNEIDTWMQQDSFFEDGGKVLVLNTPVSPDDKFECPRCGFSSGPAKGDIRITLISEPGRVSIRSSAVDMKQVFSHMMDTAQGTVNLRFPLEEEVVFEIEASRVCYRVTDGEGRAVIDREMTMNSRETIRPNAFRLLMTSRLMGRKFARAFGRSYGETIPFGILERTPERYMEMTWFSHFPREFYDAIPFSLVDCTLEESFYGAAEGLGDITGLPGKYEAAALPQTKAVRRLFFSKPGFFFYLLEAELLAEVFPDCNHFSSLLQVPYIYDLFALLHTYPGTLAFFRDCVAQRDPAFLLKRLRGDIRRIGRYAKNYCAMSPERRAAERNKWKEKWDLVEAPQSYSIPMLPGVYAQRDGQTGNGYHFSFLRNKREFVKAGKAMHNCLTEWDSGRNPVVVVKKGGEYKAAVELRDQLVIQQRACRNDSVEENPPLAAAIDKWKSLNGLVDLDMDMDYDDDEELPF